MDAHHKYTLYNEHCTLYCVYVYTVNNVKYTCIVNSVLVCCITATMQAIQCLGIAMIMKLVLYIYISNTIPLSANGLEQTSSDTPERSRRGHLNEIDEAVTLRDREALAPVWSVAEEENEEEKQSNGGIGIADNGGQEIDYSLATRL